MMDEQLEKNKGTIFNNPIQIMVYADDIGIVGRRVSSVKGAFLALSAAAKTLGLKVNEEKMKCI
jgi:hypothetical protein